MHGISRMHAAHEFVSFGRHYGEGLEPVALLVFPCVPEVREAYGVAVGKFKAVGRFRRLPCFFPFVKRRGGHDAAAFLHRFAPSKMLWLWTQHER